MPLKTERLRRTVLVLTVDQVARLDDLAEQDLNNRSRLVRQAVDEFLRNREVATATDQEGSK